MTLRILAFPLIFVNLILNKVRGDTTTDKLHEKEQIFPVISEGLYLEGDFRNFNRNDAGWEGDTKKNDK